MSDFTVILITGAARGIGYELVKLYSANPKNTVIAGVRDVNKAQALHDLIEEFQGRGKIHLVKIDAADIEGNKAAAEEIASAYGKVDILWANAGIAQMEPAISTSVANFEELFRVNTLGPVVLFQAFYDLLLKSEKPEKKFLITSSFAGSSSLAPANPFPVTAYGASKAAVNFVAVKLASEHGEKDKIAVVPIHPGLVSSDMGNDAMAAVGIDPKAALPLSIKLLSPPESAEALKALVDIVTVESHGGKFMNYDGTGIPW